MTTIKQILNTSGDWFVITSETVEEKKSSRMTRVCVWTILSDGQEDQHMDVVRGLDTYLTTILDQDSTRIEQVYVYGDDTCPNGKTWRELFNEAAADRGSLHAKDISFINQPDCK